MMKHSLGAIIGLDANFSGAPVSDVMYEVLRPSGTPQTFTERDFEVTKVAAGVDAQGNTIPEMYRLTLTADEPGTWKYKVNAKLNGKSMFASASYEVDAPAVDTPPIIQLEEKGVKPPPAKDDEEEDGDDDDSEFPKPKKKEPAKAIGDGQFVVKQIGTEYRWFGHPTVNTFDREGECVSRAGMEEVVLREKAAGYYPPLQFFHLFNIGYTDEYSVVDGVLFATGGFDSDPLSQSVAKYYVEHPEGPDGSGWAMSWRFFSWPNREGVYKTIAHIKEFTLLPFSQAANQDTNFSVGEFTKMLTPQQQATLDAMFSDPVLKAIAEERMKAESKGPALDAAGVARKDTTVAQPVQNVQPAPQPQPAPLPVPLGTPAPAPAPAPQPVPQQAKSAESPLTWGDLPELVKAIKNDLDGVIKQVDEAFAERDEIIAGLVQGQGQILAEEQQISKTFIQPSLMDTWKALSAGSSDTTVIKETDPLAAQKPFEDPNGAFAAVGLTAAQPS